MNDELVDTVAGYEEYSQMPHGRVREHCYYVKTQESRKNDGEDEKKRLGGGKVAAL